MIKFNIYLKHGFIVPSSSQNQSSNEGISLPILDLSYPHNFMFPIPLYFSEDSYCKFPKWFAHLKATFMLETSNQETINLLNVQKQITNMRKDKRLLDCMKSRESRSSCLLMCLSLFIYFMLYLNIWIGLVRILNS
jgi:hypothetical protein